MRLLSALATVALTLPCAAHAYGSPAAENARSEDNSAFLVALEDAGITFTDPDQAVIAANAVCGLAGNGKSGLEVLEAVMTANPGFTTDGAARFAAIAARNYCPHQLSPDSATAK